MNHHQSKYLEATKEHSFKWIDYFIGAASATWWSVKITTGQIEKSPQTQKPKPKQRKIFYVQIKSFGKVHNAYRNQQHEDRNHRYSQSKSSQLKVIASASFLRGIVPNSCCSKNLCDNSSFALLLLCCSYCTFVFSILGHISAHVSNPGPLNLTSARLKCSHCCWQKPACQAWASSPGKYVVVLVIFKGSRKNMLQPMLPLGASVSLLEPDTLHARAGSCLLLPCKQLFNSSVVQATVTVTWMLCVVQWPDTSVKRSSEETGQERSSTAWKTSEEKFKLAKTLSSSASMLSSKQPLSCLIRLLSDVGLMTIMRGTPAGNLGLTEESRPNCRESKESLLWPLSLSLPHGPCGISLVRLWLRPRVRTNRGRVATVREVETSSCSQPLSDSFTVDWCWWGLN